MNLFCAILWTFIFCIGLYGAANDIPPDTVVYLCATGISALHFWGEHFKE